MIDIEVNGQARRVPTRTTLRDLVELLDVGPQAVAVAVNRDVVPRQLWPSQVLLAQDRIEIVRAIGGG